MEGVGAAAEKRLADLEPLIAFYEQEMGTWYHPRESWLRRRGFIKHTEVTKPEVPDTRYTGHFEPLRTILPQPRLSLRGATRKS
ncbi:hypothetical protein BH24DEI1_BH24DEI1_16850 [soil metagenome]